MVKKINSVGGAPACRQGRDLRPLLLLIFIFIFIACSRPLYKNKFVIAGSYLEVISPDARAAAIVYTEFRRLEKIFNAFDPESELSQLNKTYNVEFKASKDLMEVLRLAQEISNLTGGAFDVSQGLLYNFWKRLIKKGQVKALPQAGLINKLKEVGGMQAMEINFANQTVKIKKKGLVLDLGAIAIGFMIDQAVAQLREEDIESALINSGGDIYCLGTNQNKPWQVGIKDPWLKDGFLETQGLADAAITTSGNYEQFFEYEGKRYSHIIDPHTGYPASSSIVSVSVISQDCTTADSLATAFFIMGIEGTKKFLTKNPLMARAILVTQDEEGKHIQKLP